MCGLAQLIHQTFAAAHEVAEIDATELHRIGANRSDDRRNQPEAAIEGALIRQ
jgi:hypothetical protein